MTNPSKATRRRLGRSTASAIAICAMVPTVTLAQDFPSEPIQIIIGFAAGGSTDTNTRALAAAAEDTCGTNIIISNQPGGSGVIALEATRGSAPDGYTLGTTPTEISAIKHMGLSDITHEDFAPVLRFIYDPHGFFVKTGSEFTNISDVIAAAEGGQQFGVATSGPASPYAILFEDLARHEGISGQLYNIPYQGDAVAIPATLSGEVDLLVTNAATALPYVESGDLVPLAVAATDRVDFLPDTPTLMEQGIEVTGGSLYGLAAPAGTPPERVEALTACFEEAFNSEAFQQFVETSGVNPDFLNGPDYAAFLEAEYTRWGELIEQLGLAAN